MSSSAAATSDSKLEEVSGLQIAYHAGFTGRAQPVLFLLEDTGLAYTRGGRDAVTDSSVFAWPRLQDGDIVLSQTVALLAYLGDKGDRQPPAALKHHALKLCLDLADVWSESYAERRKLKTVEEAVAYLGDGGRLARLLKVVDATIAACGKGGNFSCGDKPCYVDYFILNNEKLLAYMFGEKVAAAFFATNAPSFAKVAANVAALPKVKAYLESPRYEPVMYASVKADALT